MQHVLLLLLAATVASQEICPESLNFCYGEYCFTVSNVCDSGCDGCNSEHICDSILNMHCDYACSSPPGEPVLVVCCGCSPDENGFVWLWSIAFMLSIFLFTAASMYYRNTRIASPASIGIVVCIGFFFATYAFVMSRMGWAWQLGNWFSHIGYFYAAAPIGMIISPILGIAVAYSSVIKTKFTMNITPKDFNLCFLFAVIASVSIVFIAQIIIAVVIGTRIHHLYNKNVMEGWAYISWLSLTTILETIALTAWGTYLSYFIVSDTINTGNDITAPHIIVVQKTSTTKPKDQENPVNESDSLLVET